MRGCLLFLGGAATVLVLACVGVGVFNPFGLWSWVGEQVGPSCSLTVPADRAATAVLRGWKATSDCDSAAQHSSLVISNGIATSGPPLCTYGIGDISESVYGSSSDSLATMMCSNLAQNSSLTGGTLHS
jgi:hypothetical protein